MVTPRSDVGAGSSGLTGRGCDTPLPCPGRTPRTRASPSGATRSAPVLAPAHPRRRQRVLRGEPLGRAALPGRAPRVRVVAVVQLLLAPAVAHVVLERRGGVDAPAAGGHVVARLPLCGQLLGHRHGVRTRRALRCAVDGVRHSALLPDGGSCPRSSPSPGRASRPSTTAGTLAPQPASGSGGRLPVEDLLDDAAGMPGGPSVVVEELARVGV